jgi:predicted RND superfamily exporter protein
LSWLQLFERLLAKRTRLGLGLLGLAIVAGLAAARVQVDPSIERMHPFGDAAKQDFDRYRAWFPGQDAQVFVIAEGPGVFTPAGLIRLAKLETDLRALPGVRHVVGPASAFGDYGLMFPLKTRGEQANIDESLAQARSDAMSRLIVHPTRLLAIVQVSLATGQGAARVQAERGFAIAAEKLLGQQAAPDLKLTLSGAPAVRAAIARMIEDDMARLMPLVLLVILILVALAYRRPWYVVATAATLVGAWLAMIGAMGLLGLPFGILTSFAPIVIMIVSLTDTVHVLSDLDTRRRAGVAAPLALVQAMAGAAGPCLATELVIAGGFLSMDLIGLTAVWEFGLATALGVLLAWLSNMLVLPWVLSLRPGPDASLAQPVQSAPGPLDRVFAWVGRQVVQRPRRILLVSATVGLVSLLSLTQIDQEYRVFDDLRPASALARDLQYAESALGGLVPLAVLIEPLTPQPGAALTPEALAFQRRVETALADLPEHPPVVSLPHLLEPLEQGLMAGLFGRSAETTALALKQLERRQPVDAFLSADRSAAQVVALLPNVGAQRMQELVAAAGAIATNPPPGYRATVTGNLVMTAHVTAMLTQGLLSSFAAAVTVSFVAFFVALRSARLALIGLVPNVLPVAVLFALMPLLGISLKPSTVIIASMALVIADDDTLQYLLRFKRRYLELKAEGVLEAHQRAALETIHECGRAMFVTSAAVTGGFLLLLFSQFEGIANLGLLTGLTLWIAGLADAFLTPVLLIMLKPRLASWTRH